MCVTYMEMIDCQIFSILVTGYITSISINFVCALTLRNKSFSLYVLRIPIHKGNDAGDERLLVMPKERPHVATIDSVTEK